MKIMSYLDKIVNNNVMHIMTTINMDSVYMIQQKTAHIPVQNRSGEDCHWSYDPYIVL